MTFLDIPNIFSEIKGQVTRQGLLQLRIAVVSAANAFFKKKGMCIILNSLDLEKLWLKVYKFFTGTCCPFSLHCTHAFIF